MRTRLVTASALFVGISTLVACGSDDSTGSVATTTSTIAMAPITAATTTAPPVTVAPTSPPTTSTIAPTTTVATTGPTDTGDSSTTSTTAPTASALVLSGGGLGDVAFGDDVDVVIDYVTSILGVPTSDSGWADPLQTFGICPGTEVRGVTWGDLQLLFGDDSIFATGRRHFFNYVYGPGYGGAVTPAGMKTADGIGIGTKVAALRAAYPSVQVYPEEIYGPYFVVSDDLSGFLTGVTDADTIISFIGGIGCGE